MQSPSQWHNKHLCSVQTEISHILYETGENPQNKKKNILVHSCCQHSGYEVFAFSNYKWKKFFINERWFFPLVPLLLKVYLDNTNYWIQVSLPDSITMWTAAHSVIKSQWWSVFLLYKGEEVDQ